jgi:RHS repeat-associated protein
MKIGNQYYWYHNDHLGTPQMMTTTSGAVVWSAKYGSFLEATVDGSSTITNNLRAPGQYEDAETGLFYNRFRYYSPKSGKYLRLDPLSLSQVLIFKQIINNRIDYSVATPISSSDKDKFISIYLLKGFGQRNPLVLNYYQFARNNSINFGDPFGLLWYWPPNSDRTVPPTGKTLEALECTEKCLGAEEMWDGQGLLITGGAEKKGHCATSLHYKGLAVDIAGKKFQPFKDEDVLKCAKDCGFTHGWYEDWYKSDKKHHWHLQIGPGNNVPSL